MDLNAAPETKALDQPMPQAGRAIHDDLWRAFEAYKAENDDRLLDIERRRDDVLRDEKLARMDATLDAAMKKLDRMALDARRPRLSAEAAAPAPSSLKQAFDAYVRAGDGSGVRALDTRAMSFGSGPDGGFMAPPEIESQVTRRLAVISPIRAIAGVRQVSAATYRRPFARTGPVHGWVGETAARPETASPQLAEQVYPAMELYAMPSATQALLDDRAVDFDDWLVSEIETVFAEQEGKAFVTGDGINKPTGFLSQTAVANASWAWGSLGYVATGAAAGFAATNPADTLIDLVYAAKAGFRQNGRFVMNRKTQAAVRKMKDGAGQYIWAPPTAVGGEASLFTFPVTESEDMPDVAANAMPIAFGDFKRGYLVVDRMGLRVLRDPYSAKPYVLFYTTKRVGGNIGDFDAIKLLKIAAS